MPIRNGTGWSRRMSAAPDYESNEELLDQYLLFHYGRAEEILPFEEGPQDALFFPVRVVVQGVAVSILPEKVRALELGCAVGRSTFELARFSDEVVGIDFSSAFIQAAAELKITGQLPYRRRDEGHLCTELIARVPGEIDRSRVAFEQGDAMNLRPDLGGFDLVLMANLIDRQRDPRRCIERLPELVKSGGQLIIATPCTWMEEITPQENWLGGFEKNGRKITTMEALTRALENAFVQRRVFDMPLLIREHARKYQWSVAQTSVWQRK